MHNRLVSRGMNNGPVSRPMVGGGSMIGRGSMISGSSMVSRGMDWPEGRGMSSRGILFLIVSLVDLRGLSRGLAHHSGMVGTMGLVY